MIRLKIAPIKLLPRSLLLLQNTSEFKIITEKFFVSLTLTCRARFVLRPFWALPVSGSASVVGLPIQPIDATHSSILSEPIMRKTTFQGPLSNIGSSKSTMTSLSFPTASGS